MRPWSICTQLDSRGMRLTQEENLCGSESWGFPWTRQLSWSFSRFWPFGHLRVWLCRQGRATMRRRVPGILNESQSLISSQWLQRDWRSATNTINVLQSSFPVVFPEKSTSRLVFGMALERLRWDRLNARLIMPPTIDPLCWISVLGSPN